MRGGASPRDIEEEKSPSKLSAEEIELAIIPYLREMPKSSLPLGLKLRLERRLTGWTLSGDNPKNVDPLRLRIIKKNEKFSIMVNDDNLNSLQIFQKMQYNPKFLINFGQNLLNSLDTFRSFLEGGYNYDVIFIDLHGNAMNGIELMKNIRGIEKLTKSFNSYIVGILSLQDKEDPNFEEKGIDEFLFRPLSEEIINNLIDKLCLNRK